MAYATVDQVLVSYTHIKTMLGTSTTDIATTDIASYYIANAEAVVDAFVGKKYVTPIGMPQPLITRLTCDISVYDILKDKQPRIPDFIQGRYDRAMEILKDLADGDMVLTGSSVVVTSGGDNFAWSNVLSNPQGPVFRPVESFSLCVSSEWWPQ